MSKKKSSAETMMGQLGKILIRIIFCALLGVSIINFAMGTLFVVGKIDQAEFQNFISYIPSVAFYLLLGWIGSIELRLRSINNKWK